METKDLHLGLHTSERLLVVNPFVHLLSLFSHKVAFQCPTLILVYDFHREIG
jgi:hypothetical protein